MANTRNRRAPGGATPIDGNDSDGGGFPKWLLWLLGLLSIVAVVIGGFFLLGGDADVDVDPGDIEAPDVDVDVDAPDVDVTTPDVDVDVDPGDVDIEGGDADAELDPDK
ncbi:hypothetical protein [Ilumatobacter sp.]|uniref:hypothetical protein n=1 Tax=Ilumatobacter sp. TaxID=1967498 RepID=UPI003B52ECB2